MAGRAVHRRTLRWARARQRRIAAAARRSTARTGLNQARVQDVRHRSSAVDAPRDVRHDRPVSAAGLHHRLPPRRKGVRLWGMRFVGLLATAVLLGVGAFAALTAIPDGSEEAALVPAAPASTPDASAKPAKAKSRKPKLTRAQR